MWKNADRIAIGIIILMMAMQVSLFKIFAKIIPVFNYSYNTPLLCVVYVLMIVAVYVLVLGGRARNSSSFIDFIRNLWNEYSFAMAELIVMVLAIAVTDIVTLVNGQLRVTNILTHNLDYLYVFLTLPIIILLCEKKWKFRDFADSILVMTALSLMLRVFVMAYYGRTGIEIECISRESTFEGWIRNGRIRMIPPCFIMICLPLAIYMFARVKEITSRIFYGIMAMFCLFFVYYVWQSRMAILFMLCGIAVMFMFGKTSGKINIVRWIMAGFAAVIFFIIGGAKYIMALFSTDPNAAAYFAENKGHYQSYDVFWGHFAQNFLTGCGLNETLSLGIYTISDIKRQWLTDAGILYSIEPMGILIVIFFLLMFSRGIYAYIKGRKENVISILVLAITATLMVCEISIDCFFTPTAFMVPFYIAIVEYVINQGSDFD